MPYSVSHLRADGQRRVNHLLRLVLNRKVPPASKNRKNFSTRMRKSFAKVKCPNSCTTISMDSARTTCRNLIKKTISGLMPG